MTRERFEAVVGEDTILRIKFFNPISGYYNVALERVEILDGLDIMYTIEPEDIVHDGLGLYHCVDPAHTTPGLFVDRWVYQALDGEIVFEHAAPFYVRDTDLVVAAQDNWLEQCYVFIASDLGYPIADVLCVFSRLGTEEFVFQGVTSATGLLKPALDPGWYTATIFKDGYVFSRNNLEFEVLERPLMPTNRFYLYSGYTTVAPSPDNEVQSTDKCLVLVQMADLFGAPLPNARVLLESYGLHIVTGSGGDPIGIGSSSGQVKLDAHGKGQFYAVRGSTIRVIIEGTGIRRQITIPDQVTCNFLDLLTGENDFQTVHNKPIPLLEMD